MAARPLSLVGGHQGPDRQLPERDSRDQRNVRQRRIRQAPEREHGARVEQALGVTHSDWSITASTSRRSASASTAWWADHGAEPRIISVGDAS
jgi:hypothetical protein